MLEGSTPMHEFIHIVPADESITEKVLGLHATEVRQNPWIDQGIDREVQEQFVDEHVPENQIYTLNTLPIKTPCHLSRSCFELPRCRLVLTHLRHVGLLRGQLDKLDKEYDACNHCMATGEVNGFNDALLNLYNSHKPCGLVAVTEHMFQPEKLICKKRVSGQ